MKWGEKQRQAITVLDGKRKFSLNGKLCFQKGENKSWLSVRIGFDFAKYYSDFIFREIYKKPFTPLNGAHVTLANSAECEFDQKKLKKMLGKKIRVEYINQIKTDMRSFWLVVTNREELGAITDSVIVKRRYKKWNPVHLTVGNLKDGSHKIKK